MASRLAFFSAALFLGLGGFFSGGRPSLARSTPGASRAIRSACSPARRPGEGLGLG